jgi:hypothetical protein
MSALALSKIRNSAAGLFKRQANVANLIESQGGYALIR